MTVVRVDVLCACDHCDKRFGVELDLAMEFANAKTFEDLARETILNGDTLTYTWGVRGLRTVERYSLKYPPTIQADLMLCDVCSKKCDDLPIEGSLTLKQVNEALSTED